MSLRYIPCDKPCQSPSCHICEFAKVVEVNPFKDSKDLIEMFDKLTNEEIVALFKEIDRRLEQKENK
jgi:hypothetical protein